MKKKLLPLCLLLFLLISKYFNIHINCLFKEITGLYCPGCGITRMLYSIISLDFYQAFRYNILVFLMLPFIIVFYLKPSIMNKIPEKVWYGVILVIVIYGILRNIIPALGPITI